MEKIQVGDRVFLYKHGTDTSRPGNGGGVSVGEQGTVAYIKDFFVPSGQSTQRCAVIWDEIRHGRHYYEGISNEHVALACEKFGGCKPGQGWWVDGISLRRVLEVKLPKGVKGLRFHGG